MQKCHGPQTQAASMFAAASMAAFVVVTLGCGEARAEGPWKVHDMSRAEAGVVAPGATASKPPSDAVVLFDGTGLDAWKRGWGDGAAGWKVENGYMEVAPGAGITTKQSFGDCQLHIEWAAPKTVKGDSQGRGNSGVFLMGTYEIQVLDSYDNATYADGHAGSVYGQYPPLVNASRPPGEWQSYDIVFRGPKFADDGTLETPAYLTLLHNGVLVQDHVALTGPTPWLGRPPYSRDGDRGPISLQNHGNPVRFRNIWIRELPELNPLDDAHIVPDVENAVAVPDEVLDGYVGQYGGSGGAPVRVTRENGALFAAVATQAKFELFSRSETVFVPRTVDARFEFTSAGQGGDRFLLFSLGGDDSKLKKIR